MWRTIFSFINDKIEFPKEEIDKKKIDIEKEKEKNATNLNDHVTECHIEQCKEISTQDEGRIECYGTIIYAEQSNESKNESQLFTIKLNDGSEQIAFLENIKWNFKIGDKVKVHLIDKSTSGETNYEIIQIFPSKIEHKICRLTAFGDQYAVFDDNKILFYNTIENIPSLKIFDEFKAEFIQSDQKTGISTYDYRILTLLEKVENRSMEKRTKFEHPPFKIYLSQDNRKFHNKHIVIHNVSEKAIHLKSIKIVPFENENTDLIRFDKNYTKMNFTFLPKTGSFKVFFNVIPIKTGKFYFNLLANFVEFSDKHEFSVEILESYILPGRKSKILRFIPVKLPEYAVTNDLKEIDYTKFQSAKNELECLYPSLKEKLMPLNYLERMKLGIYLDEIALEKAFADYKIQRGKFESKDDYLKLTVENVAEKRPSIITGDKVIAVEITEDESGTQAIYEGFIHKIGNNLVFIKFHSSLHENHANKEYAIDFIFNRSLFRRQHHALDSFLPNSELGYNFLFPNDKICMKEIQLDASLDTTGTLYVGDKKENWFNNQLNGFQKNAVVNVLRGEKRPLPYIFFGCPGSGKTQTVVETILQIYKHVKSAKIVVATPSNSAANLILEMLLNSEVFNRKDPNFLRIVGNNQLEKELIPDNLLKYCGTVTIASENEGNLKTSPNRNKQKGFLEECTKSMILKYQILIGTLNIFAYLMQMSLDSHYSHIIVDEAGQSTEPELIIALNLMNRKSQCILAGDPIQLGPIVISRYAKHYGFNDSMLERLLTTHSYYSQNYGPSNDNYDPKFVTKLKINYRSHPTVLKVYNDMFYNGELQGAINDTDSLEALFLCSIDDLIWKNLNTNCGVFFVNVANGRNKKIPDSNSWYNDQEINGVMSFLNKCRTRNIHFKKIGVMAPYLLQVNKLKHQISFLNDVDLKVGTVEEFQGQERLIMILSTVRTEISHLKADSKFGLGFLQCPKRINVAISRARALMVIFGKQSILQKDYHWQRLIEYTKANNTFITENY